VQVETIGFWKWGEKWRQEGLKKADRFSSHGSTVSDTAQLLLARLSDF